MKDSKELWDKIFYPPCFTKNYDAEAFWTRVFGLKVGDKVRLKYGKVIWTVYALFPQFDSIKLIRYTIPARGWGYYSSPYSVMKTISFHEEVRKVG